MLHRIARAARRVLDHGDDVGSAHSSPLREIGGLGADDEDDGVRPRALRRRAARARPWECPRRYAAVSVAGAHAGARARGKHEETDPFVSSL